MATTNKINKPELLEKIKQAFEIAHAKYGEPPIYHLDSVTPDDFRLSMETYGVFVMHQPIPEYAFTDTFQNFITELSLHFFDVEDPLDNTEYSKEFNRISEKYPNFTLEQKHFASLMNWWNVENGMGNAYFRFLFIRFLENDRQVSFKVGNTDVVMDRHPFHRHNIRLLESCPKLWNLMKQFYNNTKPMVSWDSTKIRFQEIDLPGFPNMSNSAEPYLTKRHRDVYKMDDKTIDRIQLMIIKEEKESIHLGWVIFSQLPEIQSLLSQYLGMDPSGHSRVDDPALCEILDKYWRTFDDGFVGWNQETFHYEGEPGDFSANTLRTLKSFTQPTACLDKFSFRFCVGIHLPVGLDQSELEELCYLCENGYQPAFYGNHNKGKMVYYNTLDKKGNPSYKTPRKTSKYELEELAEARNDYNRETISECINELPLIIREMYGLY